MLRAADFRAEARRKLQGKWNIFALIYLIYAVIMGVCSGMSRYYIGAIAMIIIEGPFAMGLTIVSMNVVRNMSVKVEQLFEGFKDFVRTLTLFWIDTILVFLWSLLFVIPGIVMAYAYSMSFYILRDNPGMSANQARKKSIEMMKGNKWRLFCLHFSFIGWLILCWLTFGILFFWVAPYMQAAQAAFYESLLLEQSYNMAEGNVDDEPVFEDVR